MKKLIHITLAIVSNLLICSFTLGNLGTGTIEGTVIDDKGQPIPFANISVAQNGSVVTGGTTDFDGIYKIGALTTGSYEVTASTVGFYSVERSGVLIKNGEVTNADFQLESGMEVTEIVCFRGLETKCFNLEKKQELIRGDQHSQSDNSGEIGSIRKCRSSSDVSYIYIDGVKVETKPQESQALAQLSGFVVDEHENPIPFANVAIMQNGQVITGTCTNFDGIFRIKDLNPGTYEVQVSSVGYSTQNKKIRLDANAQKELEIQLGTRLIICCSLMFRPTNVIDGVVVDDSLEVIPYANLVLAKDGKQIAGTSSDLDGYFKFDDVHEGSYTLQVSAVGYEGKSVRVEHESTSELEVVLAKGIELPEVVCTAEKLPLFKWICGWSCGSVTGELTTIIETSEEDVSLLEPDIKTFPNPTNGDLTVELLGRGSAKEVELTDASGRLVLVTDNGIQDRKFRIDMSSLKSGQYHVIVRLSNGEMLSNAIIKR